MTEIAVIGGTGLTALDNLEIIKKEIHISRYGEPSAPLVTGRLAGKEVVFLPRHGLGHTIPPHNINYRANIAVLNDIGIRNIIAVNAVGGITGEQEPPYIVIPHQIIDYTWSRAHTYFEEDNIVHIDFTDPYCESLRNAILDAAQQLDIAVVDNGVYGATQGPRLETAAEIDRMERDGCDIVGMTGMPEAALARELDLCYACIALVVNKAAGRSQGEITMQEINASLKQGIGRIKQLLAQLITTL